MPGAVLVTYFGINELFCTVCSSFNVKKSKYHLVDKIDLFRNMMDNWWEDLTEVNFYTFNKPNVKEIGTPLPIHLENEVLSFCLWTDEFKMIYF